MPALVNSRHERFAQEVAGGRSVAEAYALSGYRPNRSNACVLKSREDVARRIEEIRTELSEAARAATEKAVERLSLDREWVLSRMMRNASIALGEAKVKTTALHKDTGVPFEVEVTARDAGAANRALELLGRELHMFTAKSEVSAVIENRTARQMSDDELYAIAGRGREGDSVSEVRPAEPDQLH
jgi:hypothetical protein